MYSNQSTSNPNNNNNESSNNTLSSRSSNLEIFRRSILSTNPNSNSRLRITVNLPSSSTSTHSITSNDMFASTSSASSSTGTPLSGSNRVQASLRSNRNANKSKVSFSSSTNTDTSLIGSSNVNGKKKDEFPIPNYLQHSNYYDRFYTVDNGMKGLYNDEDDVPLNSVGSSSNCRIKGKGKRVLKASDRIQLPTAWSTTNKCALISLNSNNLIASFNGSAKYGDRDAASLLSNYPIPSKCSIYYYEIQVLSSGTSGYIGLGLSRLGINLSRLPGWEKGSWAYHADDGRSFSQSGTGELFSEGWGEGDIVGCGIDWTGGGGGEGEEGGRCFFTKNGKFIKYVFSGIKGDLYPTVGLRTPGESVEVNFGHKPFKFDINSLVLERKRSISKSISQTTIPSSHCLPSTLPLLPTASTIATSTSEDVKLRITMEELISDYLIHSGFTKTSESFRSQLIEERKESSRGIGNSGSKSDKIEVDQEEEDEDIKMVESSLILDRKQLDLISREKDAKSRSEIYQLILAGKADEALKILKGWYFNILTVAVEEISKTEGDGGIYFQLQLRVFIEAVLDCVNTGSTLTDGEVAKDSDRKAARLDKLLALGRTLHSCYSTSGNLQIQESLKLAFSLMAYSDPEELANMGGEILSQDARIALADQVNIKILLSQHLPPQSQLEAIARHITATVNLLGDQGIGEAGLVDVEAELFSSKRN